MVFFPCQDSIAWTVFTHWCSSWRLWSLARAMLSLSMDCVAWKHIDVERAQTVQTTVVVQAGLFRGNGLSRSTQSLSPWRSRTSQVHGCLRRLLPVLQALTPELHGYSSGQAKRACKRSLRGYGDLSRMEMQWNNTCGLSVFLLGRCSQKAWPMGMRKWKRRACCCMSWWRAHWWSCVRRFVVVSRRGGRAVLPGYSVLGGLISWGIWTHLSLYFLRGTCSGLGHSEGGIVFGLFSKEGLNVGKASVNRTQCPGLAARLTEHIRCLYRPGLKDANKPRYRLLRRRLWGVRFFPLAVFPTISQT